MKVAFRYLVTGRVQGVGFRYFARAAAVEAGVTGTVRNLPDGSVEVWAEGEPRAQRRLTAALRAGPPAAHVTSVDARSGEVTDSYGDFTVTG